MKIPSQLLSAHMIPALKTAALGALACAAGSIAFLCIINLLMPERPFLVALVTTITISVAVAFPLLYLLSLRQNAVRTLRLQMQRQLRHDSVTGTLNGTNFAAAVEAIGERRRTLAEADQGGAMLVVSVTNLDDIGRRYGPQWADTVMQSSASIVKSLIRRGDVVGRLGLNEIGIFLPGAAEENTADIGARIRHGIEKATIVADDALPIRIEIALGGVLFDEPVEFNRIRQTAANLTTAGYTNEPVPMQYIAT